MCAVCFKYVYHHWVFLVLFSTIYTTILSESVLANLTGVGRQSSCVQTTWERRRWRSDTWRGLTSCCYDSDVTTSKCVRQGSFVVERCAPSSSNETTTTTTKSEWMKNEWKFLDDGRQWHWWQQLSSSEQQYRRRVSVASAAAAERHGWWTGLTELSSWRAAQSAWYYDVSYTSCMSEVLRSMYMGWSGKVF